MQSVPRPVPSANLRELLPMRHLDPAYRACFADGTTINVRYGREAMRKEIAQTCGSVNAASFQTIYAGLAPDSPFRFTHPDRTQSPIRRKSPTSPTRE
jgi:hypothetical protein